MSPYALCSLAECRENYSYCLDYFVCVPEGRKNFANMCTTVMLNNHSDQEIAIQSSGLPT